MMSTKQDRATAWLPGEFDGLLKNSEDELVAAIAYFEVHVRKLAEIEQERAWIRDPFTDPQPSPTTRRLLAILDHKPADLGELVRQLQDAGAALAGTES